MTERIVLCPHPRAEAEPTDGASGRVPWNTAPNHRRKFLECPGQFIDKLGRPGRGRLRVWCEYEPPTYAKATGFTEPSPQWVHTIELPLPNLHQTGRRPERAPKPGSCSGGTCGNSNCGAPHTDHPQTGSEQNTDPWIWTDGFVWSICRHHFEGELRPMIRELRAGDIVLFGSGGRESWLLDTVLVVGKQLGKPRSVKVLQAESTWSEAYRRAVLRPIAHLDCELLPILGRPRSASTLSLFSFAPCKVGGESFPRPDIATLVGKLQLNNGNAPATHPRALAACRYKDGNEAFWNKLVQSVKRKGLALGTRFAFPRAAR